MYQIIYFSGQQVQEYNGFIVIVGNSNKSVIWLCKWSQHHEKTYQINVLFVFELFRLRCLRCGLGTKYDYFCVFSDVFEYTIHEIFACWRSHIMNNKLDIFTYQNVLFNCRKCCTFRRKQQWTLNNGQFELSDTIKYHIFEFCNNLHLSLDST